MKLRKFLYLCFALWLVFPCVVVIIWMTDYDLLIGTRGTAFFIQSILNWVAAFSGVALTVLHYSKSPKAVKNKVVLFLIAVGIAVLLMCGNFLCRLFDGFGEYHSFQSPDGIHSIVIMENVSLISGQVILYERVNPFLIFPRDYIIIDDGYRPVCAGKYSLVWQENTVTLSVADGAGGNETISVTLDER